LFDLRPGELENLSVFNARRTDSFAVAAVQAAIDVGDEGIADFEAPLIHERHLANAAAR
jgi:hypothetical protein